MPVRPPVFDPPFNVVRASHVALDVGDIKRSRAFYAECLGLLVSDEDDGALYLRGVEERNHHSIVLRQARDAEVRALGFKLASEDDIDRAEAWFRRCNLPTSFVEVPFQGRTLQTADALGMPLEFYARMDQAPSMLQKYGAYHGARIQRIDHINCFTPDVQASYDFYTELGFRLTEYSETDGADPRLWAVWMQRKGNVHDLAFTNGVGPRLHHIGVWNSNVLDIIHLCDVMATTGYLANMERGPGRHGISNAFFLYVRDPDGHRIELFTSDYLTVDPDHAPIRWSLTDPQRQTLWGHPAPASWFEQARHSPASPSASRRSPPSRSSLHDGLAAPLAIPSPRVRGEGGVRGPQRMRGAKVAKTAFARRLRKNSTIAEARLWRRLRSRELNGFKFVRQEPIGPYVADFVCRGRRLIIEVDGSQHADSKRDAIRDK